MGLSRKGAADVRAHTAALGLLLLAGCAEENRAVTIEKTRVVDVARADLRPHAMQAPKASGAERFGLAPPTDRGNLRWKTPPGWSELAPTSMRAANFRVALDERTDCALTLLPGEAGGLTANVNRWRAQMSLGPQSAAEIAALPRTELLDSSAVEMDVVGTWIGMNGAERGQDYRMVGWLAIDPSGSKFLRLVGPKSVVDRELEYFRALGRSFERGSAVPRRSIAEDAVASSNVTSPDIAPEITWAMPDGWRRAPDRPLRVASFFAGADESVDCYITVLDGDGGGPLANINRWRKQMGRAPMPADALAELPRIAMLEEEAMLFEIDGTFEAVGGGSVPDALLLGALGNLPGRAVFVKMTGPRALVERQREAFLALCRSLIRSSPESLPKEG